MNRTGRPRSVSAKGLLAFLALLLAVPALAQEPVVPQRFLDERRPLRGDTVRFCVLEDALQRDFDQAVATELSNALLLNAEFHIVSPMAATPPLDYLLPLSFQEIFALLAEKCDAFMGFIYASEGYPDWLTFTRPYYRSPFVLATTHPGAGSLADLPTSERVGTRLMSQGDIRFTLFLQSLPEGRRWNRAPYADNRLLVERLVDGSVTSALIWAPALDAALEEQASDTEVRVISAEPFTPPDVRFVIALRSPDSYLRSTLDQAIAALIADGTIESLLETHGVAGSPPREP